MELLEAWKEAAPVNATLMLVGEGILQKKIEDYLSLHNITSVKLIGRIEYDNLAQYYKSADCFIIPTLEDNWSLVVPEAMACGLPIASSIYNGCYPELVTKDNGWTFDPLNKENTVDTIRKIIASKENLSKMGKESQRIASSHTPQNAAKRIYNACIEILKF